MINLLEVQPHQVSGDLKGYVIGIYGEPGVGKTTLASKIDGALLLALEPGLSIAP